MSHATDEHDQSAPTPRASQPPAAAGVLLRRLIKWDIDFPPNCWNGYAGLKELDAIIADAKKVTGYDGFDNALPVDDVETCIACEQALKAGDLVYNDASGDLIHAACCGPERESYTGKDGEPLKDGEPIPEPWPWSRDDTSAPFKDTPAGWVVPKKQGDGVFLSAEDYDEASAAAEADIYDCGYFAVYARQPTGGDQ